MYLPENYSIFTFGNNLIFSNIIDLTALTLLDENSWTDDDITIFCRAALQLNWTNLIIDEPHTVVEPN